MLNTVFCKTLLFALLYPYRGKNDSIPARDFPSQKKDDNNDRKTSSFSFLDRRKKGENNGASGRVKKKKKVTD